jgi:hypothetical protein
MVRTMREPAVVRFTARPTTLKLDGNATIHERWAPRKKSKTSRESRDRSLALRGASAFS